MPIRLHSAVFAIAASVLMAMSQTTYAQMRGAGLHGVHFASGRNLSGSPIRSGPKRHIYLGEPFLYSDYYAGDYYPASPYYIESGPPQIVMARPPVEEPPQSPVQALMIELQGDHYVRTGGFGNISEASAAVPQPDIRTVSRHAGPAPAGATQIASMQSHLPTVLVYRDGHREDVSGYAIIHAVIYARGNYYQDGYWTKNIQLSALNIPATMKANQENGVKFILPAGPDEVVARP